MEVVDLVKEDKAIYSFDAFKPFSQRRLKPFLAQLFRTRPL
jgi:hypothetical protein